MKPNELAALAAAEEMIPNAPVQARRSVDIDAPIEKVWHSLTAVPGWSTWYPYLKNARLDGPFQAGTGLIYGGMFKHHLRLAKVKERKLVMIYGTFVGYTAITRWNLEKLSAGRTRVSFQESSDGFMIGTLYSEGSLGKHLQTWLDKLKLETEQVK